MIKRLSRIALASALFASLVVPTTISAEGAQFSQGEQYEQGMYDLSADQPSVYNWNRNSAFKSIDSDPYIKWTFSPENSRFQSPIVIGSDGTIYGGDMNSNTFYALNPDGTEKWSFKSTVTGENFDYRTKPAIGTDGTIYVNSSYGIRAINPNGTEKWGLNLGRVSPPVIGDDGTLYFIKTKLYAVDPLNGDIKWKSADIHSNAFTAPVISKDGIIYISSLTGLEAYNKSGVKLWKFSPNYNYGLGSAVIAEDGTIYTGLGQDSQKGYMYAVNPDGTEKWKFQMKSYTKSPPTIGKDGTLYFGTESHSDKTFYAVKPDGSLKWSVPLDTAYNKTAPILDSSENIYFTTLSNTTTYLHAINFNGEKLWDFTIEGKGYGGGGDAPLAIGKDGTIYAITGQGITAIGGKINPPFNFCEVFNRLTQRVNNGFSSKQEVVDARENLELLKAKIQELESKIEAAEQQF